MTAPAVLHAIDALRVEVGGRVMKALGDEHDWPRRTIADRAWDANHAFEATA